MDKRWLALMFFVALSPAVAPAVAAADAAPFFMVEMKGAEKIEWSEEGDGILFSVFSRGGVGRATITPRDGNWPPRVSFRLYLKGLERFRVDNGAYTVNTSVSSLPPHGVRCELITPGRGEVSLMEKDPRWTPAVLIPGEGDAARIPLANGCIEVRPPETLLKEKPAALKIQWVDFFR